MNERRVIVNGCNGLTDEEASGLSSMYWHWHGVATLLRRPYRPEEETDVGLIGFPYSGGNAV